MKIIDDLLRIKTHREHQAEMALAHASRALRMAVEAAQKAQESLDQAHAEHDARKHALYEDLFSRLVQLSDLDLARSRLEKMDANIKECELALQAAQEKMASAEKVREQKRIHYRDASRAREKYTELSTQAAHRQKQIQNMKDEIELEEVCTKPRDRTLQETVPRVETAA